MLCCRALGRDVMSQPAAEAVVRSILNLGRDFGLTCLAEGLETPEQVAFLQQRRCSELLGFL